MPGSGHKVRLALKAQREPAFLAFLRAPRSSGDAGEHRDGRVLAGGDQVGDRSRVEGRGDQLHGDQHVGARPGCRPRGRGAPQRGSAEPARPCRQAGSRVFGRRPYQPADRRRVPRAEARPTPETGRRSSGSTRSGSDEALDIARAHDLTIDTVHVHAGYLYLTDALPSSTRRCVAWPRPPGV